MKQIIEGRMYDTETAQLLSQWWNGKTGFNRYEEALYLKKTGEYFLHREGGPMTTIVQSCAGNSYIGCEAIIPYSEVEAQEWAEKYADAEEYIAIWGTPEE